MQFHLGVEDLDALKISPPFCTEPDHCFLTVQSGFAYDVATFEDDGTMVW